MKLYTTPPFILTLMTWVPQSRLAFGILRHFGTWHFDIRTFWHPTWGGGGYLVPKLLRNFFACVWTFFRKRGGVAWVSFFLLWDRHFPRKMWEDDQNPNTLKNFSSYKIRFLKSSSKRSKNTGGGSRLFGKNSNRNRFFLWMASPMPTAPSYPTAMLY